MPDQYKIVNEKTAPDLFLMLAEGRCSLSKKCSYKPYKLDDLCINQHLEPIMKLLEPFIVENKIPIAGPDVPLTSEKAVHSYIYSLNRKNVLCSSFMELQKWCKANPTKCKDLTISDAYAPGLFGSFVHEGNTYNNGVIQAVDKDNNVMTVLAYVDADTKEDPDPEVAVVDIHGKPLRDIDPKKYQAVAFVVPTSMKFVSHYILEDRMVKPGKPCRKGDKTCWTHKQLEERATELGYTGSLSANKAKLATYIQAMLDAQKLFSATK